MNLTKDLKNILLKDNKKHNNEKLEKINTIISIILVVLIVALETTFLPTILSASFINRNSAAHMLFDMNMDVEWNSKTEYEWTADERLAENINEVWSSEISDLFVEGYTQNFYTNKIIAIVDKETDADMHQFRTAILISTFNDYTNDFIKMQAGFLVGDNGMPEPSVAFIQESLGKVFALVNDDLLNEWYQSNAVVLSTSLAHAMTMSNEYLSNEALQSNENFKEAVLVLKILNLFIAFYFILGIIVILMFCMLKIIYCNKTYLVLFIGQCVAAFMSTIHCLDLSSIGLMVLGHPYTPTQVMIKDALPLGIATIVILLIVGCVFLALHFNKKKNFKAVISRKKP